MQSIFAQPVSAMNDPYLYKNSRVLKNLLNITDEKELDLAEAELSRANMMILYDQGFQDFSPEGMRTIHRFLFGDVYEWAGKYRKINIQKREEILGGASVWYANDDVIEKELRKVFKAIDRIQWKSLTKQQFVSKLARLFPKLWQIHPFREGNTRTTVMLLTFFVEQNGYFFDQELFAASAGYVRNAFVLASIGKHSEYEHLERILNDAVCDTPPEVFEGDVDDTGAASEKYEKYRTKDYQPAPHEYREENN